MHFHGKVVRLAVGIILALLLLPAFGPISTSAASPPVTAIVLVNSSSSPSQANFQQVVTIIPWLYSRFERSDLGNIRFCAAIANPCTGTPLDSWLQSCGGSLTACSNTASSATFWVNLGPNIIPAGGELVIYMIFLPTSVTFDGRIAGESPQLSATYGEFDNGANVFSFYDDFAGGSLNLAKWNVVPGLSYTVSNGLTYNGGSCNDVSVTSVPSFVAPYAVDFLGAGTTDNDMGIWFGAQSRGPVAYVNLWTQRGTNVVPDQFYVGLPAPYSFSALDTGSWSFSGSGYSVYSLLVGPDNFPVTGQKTHSTVVTTTGLSGGYTTGYLGPRYCGGSESWQWIRVRAYPPGGSMPSELTHPCLPVRSGHHLICGTP